MNRRDTLLALLPLGVAPLNARAQTPQHARIGSLSTGTLTSLDLSSPLRKLGWVEGRNLTLERRFAEGRDERLAELASQLVQLGVQVIVAPNDPAIVAARRVNVFCGNRISPTDDTAMENLARYIIRASFSQERMQYLDQEGTVVYAAKDGKSVKVFPAMEWLAAMCSHRPNRGEQMVQYHGFGITIRHFSTTDNPYFDYIAKNLDS